MVAAHSSVDNMPQVLLVSPRYVICTVGDEPNFSCLQTYFGTQSALADSMGRQN